MAIDVPANMDTPELKIGIVGLGTHGTNHAKILTDLGHQVLGVDTDRNVRRESQQRFDIDTYEHPSDLFAADIDATIISTPNKFHKAVALEAFDAGLDVLLEKPLAHTRTSAERIAEAAVESDSVCMTGFHHRYRNICQVAKSYIEDGYLGDLTHIQAKFIRRRGVPGRGTWYTSKEIAGGGAMMDVGGHLIDLLLFFCGWPAIEEVMATRRSDFGQQEEYAYLEMWGEDGQAKMYDVEDSVTAFCEFDSGTTASIEVAWAANTEATHSYLIRGTEAGAYLDITNSLEEVEPVPDERNALDLYEARSGRADHFVNSEVVAQLNNPYEDELRTFIDAVVSGDRPDANNVHQALAVQHAIDEIYTAATNE
jgi:predicted dehydrogenase